MTPHKHQWQITAEIKTMAYSGGKDMRMVCVKCEDTYPINVYLWKDEVFKTEIYPSKCGKITYKTAKDAKTVLNFARHLKRIKRAERVYHCPDCNGWHLTSKVKS